MRLLTDEEERVIETAEDLADIIEFRTKNDKIFTSRIADLSLAVRMTGESVADFKARVGTSSLPDHIVEDHHGMYLIFILESDDGVKRRAVLPLRDIALDSVYERARANCFTISNTDTTGEGLVLPIEEKIDFLNKAFKLYGGIAKILFRDEKITSVMSGQYYFISFDSINQGLLALKEDFPKMEFKDGKISQSFFTESYLLNSDEFEEDLLLSAQDAGIDVDEVSVEVSAYSCDHGKIAATFSGKIGFGDKKILFGTPISVKHAGKKTDEDIKRAAKQLYSSFKDNTEKIKALPHVKIDHPAGCMRLIAKEYHLPKRLACEIAETLEAKTESTAYEIYWKLNQIVQLAEEKGMDMMRLMLLQDAVARTLNVSYKKYDKIFLWNKEDKEDEA